MYLLVSEILKLGVSESAINKKLASGEWKIHDDVLDEGDGYQTKVLFSSLPVEIQKKWAQHNPPHGNANEQAALLNVIDDPRRDRRDDKITKLLSSLKPEERNAWIAESIRLGRIVERYDHIKPKRRRSPLGAWMFTASVIELCEESICKDQRILSRHPHKANAPSPHTLDGWCRTYRRIGLITFLPKERKPSNPAADKRRALLSKGAMNWINAHWRNYSGPHSLYKAWKKEAGEKGWCIPSQSWLYRRWSSIPNLCKTFYFEGEKAYISKHAPYVPRDYSGLHALQILCGDHSERDVSVLLPDKTLARPWLSAWYDLRTGLLWGWHIDLIPSSHTAGLAYADGVENFGAQPPTRPADDYYSYVYTDHGRDYKSHNWDGRVIAIHKKAMTFDDEINFLLVERRVGILEDLSIKHLLARPHNAKEKPIERVFKDISEWEKNTFKEYCGRDAKSRPDLWRKLYAQHQMFVKGRRDKSPFMTLERYRRICRVRNSV